MKHILPSCFLLVAALAFCVPAARAETVVRRVVGHGSSHDDAVRVGLVEAVRQVSGTALESTTSMTLSAAEITSSASTAPGGGVSASSAVASQTLDEKTDTVTRGVVTGYSILSENHNTFSDVWEVEMEVSVALYKTPGLSPESRRKIAILPFKTPSDYPVGERLLASGTVSRDMADRLIALFTQSRRFAVLSRQDDDVLKAEKDLIIREAPVAEMAKIGQTLGADYLLAGTVADLNIGAPVRKENSITGSTTYALPYARLKVQYRIVVVGTGQIKFADDIYVELDRDQLRAARGDAAAAYEMLKREVARRIAWRALSAIYPAHVVDLLDSGEIAFDEGGSLVIPGSYYDIFRLGADVRSHSSGESLGRTEERIATAIVTRVDAKMSYAKPVEGNVTWEDFDQGLIIRPARPVLELAPSAAAYPAAVAYPGAPAAPAAGVALPAVPGAGVKLPFD
jgi:curli biogenesis system outer membrane secretion channel CsgG